MRADVLIVGQGLAGTLLGWALERAGVSFVIGDPGHGAAASRVGAGIINPITGRRLVKGWRVEEWLPLARTAYQEIGATLGVPVWHELRVRRCFADEGERAAFAAKAATGELAPFARGGDEEGFWIEGAARVDVTALLGAAREHWRQTGRLRTEPVAPRDAIGRHAVVIDCRGLAAARDGAWDFVPWEFAKGERLEIAVAGLEPDVILNRRRWVMPVDECTAWVGATHEPGVCDAAPSAAARAALEAAARELLGSARPFVVMAQHAGVRVTARDKRPVVGLHPREPRLGAVNALGGKGALLAPALAAQWTAHLLHQTAFDRALDVARFEK